MPGERRHPTSGVAGSKPRQRIAKLPIKEIEEQSRIYLAERNQMMRLRRKREGMRLAVERDQLIEKELCIKQLSFLVIETRQKLLTMPQRVGARVRAKGAEEVARVAAGAAREVVYETLAVLAELPLKVTDPNWLEALAEEGEPDKDPGDVRQHR